MVSLELGTAVEAAQGARMIRYIGNQLAADFE